jgi:cytochrome c2
MAVSVPHIDAVKTLIILGPQLWEVGMDASCAVHGGRVSTTLHVAEVARPEWLIAKPELFLKTPKALLSTWSS